MDQDNDFDFDGAWYCLGCDNKGYVIICCDDLCANEEYCIHGDGQIICPECEGQSVYW